MSDQTHPWEPLPGEPEAWFERFDRFRLLGPGRTVDEVWRAEKGGKGRKPNGYWCRAIQKYRWQERAAAWDASQRAERQKQREEEARKRRDTFNAQIDVFTNLEMKKSIEALKDRPAKDIETMDAVKMFESAARLKRQALDDMEDHALLKEQLEEMKQRLRDHGIEP